MRVRALHDVYYDGKNHKTGDEFDVADEHGRLMAINESVAQVATTIATHTTTIATHTVEASGTGKRRDYRRRDMRADE